MTPALKTPSDLCFGITALKLTVSRLPRLSNRLR